MADVWDVLRGGLVCEECCVRVTAGVAWSLLCLLIVG